VSFGSAASRPVRRVEASAPCPCGSGDTFGGCCRLLMQEQQAPTAERLMRSRYTAFVIGDAEYLAQTWHPRTRPHDIEIDPDLRWTGLQVVVAEAGGEDDVTGVVEFRAAWKQGAGTEAIVGVLRERSRFARVRGRWFYLDGDVG
jgi:SEC-C motif-containing protein